jgi:Trk K+ transport system NAD-binding subunit
LTADGGTVAGRRYHPVVAEDSWLAHRFRPSDKRRRGVRRSVPDPSAARHLIVWGDDPLAYRVVEELVNGYKQTKVTVIVTSKRHGHGRDIARLPSVRIVEAAKLDEDVLRHAGVATAAAVALLRQDDVGNIHSALRIQELNAKAQLVIRMYNTGLGEGIRRLIPDSAVLSDAAMAAPEFVSAALGEVAPIHLRVAARTLYVARRGDVRPDAVLCALTATRPGGDTELLPADADRADLVLAVADGHALTELTASGGRTAKRVPRRRPWSGLPTLVSRKLQLIVVVMLLLLIAGTVLLKFARGNDITWLSAAYFAILDTLAGANPDPTAAPLVKLTETALTVVSIALIPLLTAAVVEAAVNARLALALGRLKAPVSGHVVVVGLGNVGTRVIRRLHDFGVAVVAIDKDEAARGIPVARKLGIPYIIGDASSEETLRAASVQTSRALVVLSTDDVTNLGAALQARRLQDGLRVVLRLFDGDFAGRVQRAFGITISRSVSFLAAPAFADAMLERDVVGSIPIGRRLLLVSEVPVNAGSPLIGSPLSAVADNGDARVIAVTVERRRNTMWAPDQKRLLQPGDVVYVVATKAGHGRLLTRTAAPD